MSGTSQTFAEAADTFVEWLDRQVTEEGRGDRFDRLEVEPAATFWLGRLLSEQAVQNSQLGDRADRLDPCAIGIRLKPDSAGPWHLEVTSSVRAWVKEDPSPDPDRPWRRCDRVTQTVRVSVEADGPSTVTTPILQSDLAAGGADGLRAEVRIDVEHHDEAVELVVQLVNTSPEQVAGLHDTHLYETRLSVTGVATTPFFLEALPDSFRYDRLVPAFGVNVGVTVEDDTDGSAASRRFRTTDTVVVETRRPEYWNSARPLPDLSFASLAADPVGPLTELNEALSEWNRDHWSTDHARNRAAAQGWDDTMWARYDAARGEVSREQERIAAGLRLLRDDETVRTAFRYMNRAIAYSAAGKYDSWRPFQIAFLLGALNFLVDREGEGATVDTVWFATGGGKTETYLGMLVTAAFHDRLTGKSTGVTAWSRFPLRLLSLQQTQRFADALAGAERVRREEAVGGAPFSLGFLVGRGGTPNQVKEESTRDDPDPDSPGMPDRYQVLLRCPFCHGDTIEMRFDRRFWRLSHTCTSDGCPWPDRDLPVYVVDYEIYRFLPTVVLGTLDKAASVGFQPAMRGLVGPPMGLCSEPMHGYTYAPRSDRAHGCLVPRCPGARRQLPMARQRYAPSMRLQDELHLLRDSLGAVDSHYESLLDHLQAELGAPPAKIVASSATLAGHDRQVDVLYRREGRVFPLQGPTTAESFWSRLTPARLRRFVAVAPRGVTLEHVSDRTLNVLQASIRRLLEDAQTVCAEVGVDVAHAARLTDMYGTDVIYGNTLHEVEAAERSLTTNSELPINSVQMTGQTDFDEVRAILERLESPEASFADRIHAVAASSMLSHGVDVARLNVMVMMGLPLGSAEFIQTSARVGRTHPGLVYVLHKIGRERDAQTYRQFHHFVTHGDRFVDPVPVTRRSRRVLRLTLPGIVEARRLALYEPTSPTGRLTMVKTLREFVRDANLGVEDQTRAIADLLGFAGSDSVRLREEIERWLKTWFTNLFDPATSAKWPNQLSLDQPMISLRDVESRAPIGD